MAHRPLVLIALLCACGARMAKPGPGQPSALMRPKDAGMLRPSVEDTQEKLEPRTWYLPGEDPEQVQRETDDFMRSLPPPGPDAPKNIGECDGYGDMDGCGLKPIVGPRERRSRSPLDHDASCPRPPTSRGEISC